MIEKFNYILSQPDFRILKIEGLFKELFLKKSAIVQLSLGKVMTRNGIKELNINGLFMLWMNDKFHIMASSLDTGNRNETIDLSKLLEVKEIKEKRKGFVIITGTTISFYVLLFYLSQLITNIL